jgi:hypothetical protein
MRHFSQPNEDASGDRFGEEQILTRKSHFLSTCNETRRVGEGRFFDPALGQLGKSIYIYTLYTTQIPLPPTNSFFSFKFFIFYDFFHTP